MRRWIGLGVLALAACKVSFDFDLDDATFTDTSLVDSTGLLDEVGDLDDAPTDDDADSSTGTPLPTCGLEAFAGVGLTWSRAVVIDGLPITTMRDVAIDPLGDVVVLLDAYSPGQAADIVVAKYTIDGTLAWTVVFDGDAQLGDEAWALAIDGFADIYAVGSETTAEVGGTVDARTVVLKVGADGSKIWRYKHEVAPPPLFGSNARGAAMDAAGSAIAVLLGPTYDGATPTEVLVLDRFGVLLQEFVRAEIGEPVGIEITSTGDLILAGGAGDPAAKWLARVAVDGQETWTRSDASEQIWRAAALASDDSMWLLADWGDAQLGESGTTVRRFAADGTPHGSVVVDVFDALSDGSGHDLAPDCAGGVEVTASEWTADGLERGRLARVADGDPWSTVLQGGDLTSPGTRIAADATGTVAIAGGAGTAWVARFAVP